MVRIRPKCRRVGHRFAGFQVPGSPFQFCNRWFCEGARVAAWVPDGPFRDSCEQTIDRQGVR